MIQAREQIFSGIRKALGRDTSGRSALSPQVQAELDGHFKSPPGQTHPGFSETLVTRFVDRLQAAAGTITGVTTIDEVPGSIGAYLESHALPKRLVAAPGLQSLPWPDGLEVSFGATRTDDGVSVNPCFAAVAETGSVVLLSGPNSPTTLDFLPDDRVIIVQTEQIVRHIEDVWSRLRDRPEGMPRTVNFITGPSRTADVEQTLQLGTHGPRRLHIVLVEA